MHTVHLLAAAWGQVWGEAPPACRPWCLPRLFSIMHSDCCLVLWVWYTTWREATTQGLDLGGLGIRRQVCPCSKRLEPAISGRPLAWFQVSKLSRAAVRVSSSTSLSVLQLFSSRLATTTGCGRMLGVLSCRWRGVRVQRGWAHHPPLKAAVLLHAVHIAAVQAASSVAIE